MEEQFIQVAIAYRIEPFHRDIHALPCVQGEYRELSLIVGNEVYLKRAENTGRLNGQAVWDERSGEEMKAVVETHRKDRAAPFRHEVPWTEAAKYNCEGKLTAGDRTSLSDARLADFVRSSHTHAGDRT